MSRLPFESEFPAGTPSRRRRVREALKRGIALLLVFTIGCASKGEIVVHDRGEVCAQTEERLRVVVRPGDEGSLQMCVFREREQTLEIHYWKMPTSGQRGTPYAEQQTVRAGDEAEFWGMIFVYGVAGVAAVVIGAIAACGMLVGGAVGAISKAVRGKAPPGTSLEEQKATVWRVETVRQNSIEATIERADGTAKVTLRRQPITGWVLDDRTMLQLGGRGAQVVVRDGELSAEVILDLPR